ncbi:hypothetical protein DOTSEDRAFT_126000 [Dothistroma septosporum NZE10]|uniref:N-acetylglucosamine-induced protein 1 n=1 Tax=Dothistroma septosporum (strain NZE10 / CBS 128990) TaxID=675120 RepID=N1PWG2_DOTSN|nr:hypothetical protein DOTSEDRAFT_126000 [Dothistroma septosporum NZE10]
MAVANSHGGAGGTAHSTEAVPFWNVNLPRSQWTPECPSYLHYALENDKDRGILSTPDSHYTRQTWPQVKQIVCENRLADFDRVPSELRLYREFCSKLIRDHGSIISFMLSHRLHWPSLTPSGNCPFTSSSDYRILYNDWPYGIDERIVHLIVWTKFHLPADPDSKVGDMAKETRDVVDGFVAKTFGESCGRDNVIWFKNWAALKSVHAVEHVHVMLLDPDPGFVESITVGDVPLFRKVKGERDRVEIVDVEGR